MNLSEHQSLAPFTSLHVGGPAERLARLEEGDDLQETIVKVAGQGPVWVLGYGSNCLISDQGLPGTVILNQTGTIQDLGEMRFRVDSGVNWDNFVQLAIKNNLYGLEFTSGIPGGTGAAVVGNIAAYGHKVADSFVEATVFNPEDGSVTTWDKGMLGFDYRSSTLQSVENSQLIVLNAVFQLYDQPTSELEYESALKTAGELGLRPDSLENRRRIIMETRKRAGSLLTDNAVGPWTAGSFFKNPVVGEEQIQAIIEHEETSISRDRLLRQNQIHGGTGARVSAAHVLLAAGFKRGQTWGNVRLHPDHILKVENIGSASAKEIYDVVQHILTTVKVKLGIGLETEVKILGKF